MKKVYRQKNSYFINKIIYFLLGISITLFISWLFLIKDNTKNKMEESFKHADNCNWGKCVEWNKTKECIIHELICEPNEK